MVSSPLITIFENKGFFCKMNLSLIRRKKKITSEKEKASNLKGSVLSTDNLKNGPPFFLFLFFSFQQEFVLISF